jgi:hypothetical protein
MIICLIVLYIVGDRTICVFDAGCSRVCRRRDGINTTTTTMFESCFILLTGARARILLFVSCLMSAPARKVSTIFSVTLICVYEIIVKITKDKGLFASGFFWIQM